MQRKTVYLTQGDQTNADGTLNLNLPCRNTSPAADLEGGLGRFYLQASVIDQASTPRTGSISLCRFRSSALVIEAMPEGRSDSAQPGEHPLRADQHPDGARPRRRFRVSLAGKQFSASDQGPYGLAEMRFTPQSNYMKSTIDAR